MLMHRIMFILILAAVGHASSINAADKNQQGDIKELSGISIKGDKEAPKSLYIVPWQTSEHELNTSFDSKLSDSDMQTLDRESLRQQLRLYELSKTGWHKITTEGR